MATADFVRLELSKTHRVKLRFKHRELRNAVTTSKRSIGDLLGDPFGGWPYLLAEGHRPWDSTITLDKASDIIQAWVDTPDPNTGEARTLDQLAEKLMEALKASKFVTVRTESSDEDGEGNASPEAVV